MQTHDPMTHDSSVIAERQIAGFTVHVFRDAEGGFVADVPALDGCVSEGETVDEAMRNIREAIGLYLESLRERGLPVPGAR